MPGSNRRPPSGNGSSVPPVTTSSTSPNVILSTATLATTSQQNSTSPPRRHVSIVSQAQNTLIQGEFRPSPMWEMARIHRWNTSGLFCYYTTSWDITIIFNEDYFNPKQGKFKNNLNKIYKYLMFHNRCYLDPTQISKGVT